MTQRQTRLERARARAFGLAQQAASLGSTPDASVALPVLRGMITALKQQLKVCSLSALCVLCVIMRGREERPRGVERAMSAGVQVTPRVKDMKVCKRTCTCVCARTGLH